MVTNISAGAFWATTIVKWWSQSGTAQGGGRFGKGYSDEKFAMRFCIAVWDSTL